MSNPPDIPKQIPEYFHSSVEAELSIEVTPEELDLVNVVGEPNVIVHELRSTDTEGTSIWAAVVKVDPCSFDYHFAADEVIHVLEGHATVRVAGGGEVALTPGSIASFSRGTSSTWTVHKSLKEFAVLIGS